MLHTVLKRSRRYVSFTPSSYPASFSSTGYVPKPINIGFVICPQQSAFVIERFGKFSGVLEAGIHPLIPLADRVAYAHSLKEQALSIPSQSAITKDNVTISIDGVLYIRVMDPYAASYGVSDPIWAVTQLAQTTMRSELGKYSLDRTFAERDALNSAIVATINSAATTWGISCLRCVVAKIWPWGSRVLCRVFNAPFIVGMYTSQNLVSPPPNPQPQPPPAHTPPYVLFSFPSQV